MNRGRERYLPLFIDISFNHRYNVEWLIGGDEMLIEVADLRRAGCPHGGRGNEKEFTGKTSRFEIELQGDLFVFSDVLVEGRARNVGGKIYIKGSIRTKVNLTCSRCLTPFSIPIDTSFEETYYAAGSMNPDDLESAGRIYQGDQIDLRDVIIESLILTLPMKPVCHQECRGLCPACGCNLNTDHCDCGPQAPDPRLAVLDDLFKSIKN